MEAVPCENYKGDKKEISDMNFETLISWEGVNTHAGTINIIEEKRGIHEAGSEKSNGEWDDLGS